MKDVRGTDVCNEPEDPGSCDEYVINYSYDRETQSCKAFYYGGCGGNSNRFETRIECESNCVTKQHEGKWNSSNFFSYQLYTYWWNLTKKIFLGVNSAFM